MNLGPLALESTALPTELSRLDVLYIEIRAKIMILASGQEMDPDHRAAGIFKFMLDLVSDNEIDGLADLIPKL